MAKVLATLALLVASLFGVATPAHATECAADLVGDANIAAGAAGFFGLTVPDVGVSDVSADFTEVCLTVTDTTSVTFEVVSDAGAEQVERNFTATLGNFVDCYVLTLVYERRAHGDAGRVTASTPDGCEPPPWFISFSSAIGGVDVGHTAGTNKYRISVPNAQINAVIDPQLGYAGSPGFYFDRASSSYPLPVVGPVLDRVWGAGP